MFLSFPVCCVRQLFLCNCITKQNTDDNINHIESTSLIYNSHANRLPNQSLTGYHNKYVACNVNIYFEYRITLQQTLEKLLKLKNWLLSKAHTFSTGSALQRWPGGHIPYRNKHSLHQVMSYRQGSISMEVSAHTCSQIVLVFWFISYLSPL